MIVPNENIKLVGVARSDKSSDEEIDYTPKIDNIKINPAQYQDMDTYHRLKKVKSRDRYIGMKEHDYKDSDEEAMYNIEET